MMRSLILCGAITVFCGCVAQPVDLTPAEQAVRVYSEAPDCSYEDFGLVSAQSGSVAWDVEGNEAASVSKLKKEAAAIGATAIIIAKSETGDRQWHSAGVQHQMTGQAIRCKE